MATLFISDLHLAEGRPELTALFRAFVAGPAQGADALYILGDLFEYWVGDDDRSHLSEAVAEALAGLAASGTALHFMAGNRDFLVGEAWAGRVGMDRLADPTLIRLGGQPILLMHGDTLCTDDLAYQAYRRQVRDPAFQAGFLAQSLAARRAFVEQIRARSEAAKQEKVEAIMDVNAEAVADAFRQHDYPILLHGHTHRPAHHRLEIDGRPCERWVLSDWRDSAPYLAWTGSGLESREFRPG